jgi:hypothetical protein
MTKTSVYLTDEERQRLAELSRETGKSQAQIIREAIAQYQPAYQPRRHFALFNSGRGPGGSVADVPDEELFEGFGEQ